MDESPWTNFGPTNGQLLGFFARHILLSGIVLVLPFEVASLRLVSRLSCNFIPRSPSRSLAVSRSKRPITFIEESNGFRDVGQATAADATNEGVPTILLDANDLKHAYQ